MALFRGKSGQGGLFLVSSKTDSPAAGVYDMRDDTTEATNPSAGPLSGNTGVGAAAKIFQVYPNGGALGATTAANTTLANNAGWWVPPTTYMGATSSQQRVIPAGTNITTGWYIYNATSTAGATCTLTLRGYKRSAAGALTLIFTCQNTFAIPALSSGAVIGNVGAGTGALGSDIVFAAGETLYVEQYITIPGATVTANSCNVNLNSVTSGSSQSLVFGTNGVAIRYLQALSASSTVSAAKQVAVKVSRSASVSATAAKQVLVSAFKSASASATAAAQKLITKSAQAATATATAVRKLMVLTPKSAAVIATADRNTLTIGKRVTATATASGASARAITKNVAAAITSSAAIQKFLNLHRAFSAAATASGAANLARSQAAIVRKVITYIFDD